MLFLKLGVSFLISFHFVAVAGEATVIGLGDEQQHNSLTTTTTLRGGSSNGISRRQLDADVGVTCLGDTLLAGQELKPNESICVTMSSGEIIHLGLFTYPMLNQAGLTLYRPEIKSSSTTYKKFIGVGTSGDPGNLTFQKSDGNLVFSGNHPISGCIVMPGVFSFLPRFGGMLKMEEVQGNKLQVQITDNMDGVVWRYDETECYPTTPNTCLTALHVNSRIGWKKYLCTYDRNGNVVYRFGLNEDAGLFGLWKGSKLIWRPDEGPDGSHVRGDYLHFQNDGHLTVYRNTTPKKDYRWTSGGCIDWTATKLVLTSDGDVQEISHSGAIVWSLLGSKAPPGASSDPRDSVPEICMPRSFCAIPPTSPLFTIDDDVNIGDALRHPGPGFTASCGPRCYDVKDSGDDPPFDPELGDTLRFAYKEVSADNFHFRAKVCGTKCNDEEWTFESMFLGDTGLMVRESLDPLGKNLFAGHQPHYQATWSYRTETDGGLIRGFDGSPDVECLWVNLVRHSQEEFSFSYNYPSWGDDVCAIEPDTMLNTTVTIPGMPTTVFVGLAVSTAVSPPFCRYTEARFSEIEFLFDT